MLDLDARHLRRGRQQVVHEGPREELRLVVVGRPLEQHRADALRDAAAYLALDDRRVDELPAVLDDDPTLDGNVTSVDVDLDDGAVGTARPAALSAVEDSGDLEVAVVLRGGRHLSESNGADGDARHRNLAIVDDEVSGRGLEQVG